MMYIVTRKVYENDGASACYTFNMHQPILIKRGALRNGQPRPCIASVSRSKKWQSIIMRLHFAQHVQS